ncbi:hypothetical protein [Salinibacter ruber]|uniref:hypothetical protein n=1 Tax=Salinibacter ruber TaxID=146919 RepID=UPI002169420A|nr:hypothetical protein [Salinibacter ruber]MCS3611011.1 hypothetical protein [Salinibacter ruber]
MTNQELLNRSNALQRAAEAVQTTRMRYAIQKNLREVQALIEPYQETLEQIAEEHEVESLEDPPEGFEEEIEDLLAEDGGDPDVHTVPPQTLDREDEKGTDLPMDVIAGIDWMIASE